MTKKSHERFELSEITGVEWVILDTAFEANDARRTVAYVWKVDEGEFEVVWLQERSLPRWYGSAEEALADVMTTAPRSRRPTAIPSRPPLAGLSAAS